MNDLTLGDSHPATEELKPIKVGGESTALEVSKEDVRVNNLYVNGTTSGVSATDSTKLPLAGGTMTGNLDMGSEDITASDGFTIDVGGDMSLDAAGGDIALKAVGNQSINLKVDGSPRITMYETAGVTDDYFEIRAAAGGSTTLLTVDDAGSDGDFSLDIDGDIKLDSETGVFDIKKSGTKFADMYAGMILGYTVIGLDATPATHDVLAAMTVVHDDLKVSFVFPPSGKVEIMASIYIQTDSARGLTFGLSTADTSGYASLGAEYENGTFFPVTGADGEQHEHRWYVTGTAGDSEELWFAAGCTHTNRFDLYWGGDSSSVADGSHPVEYQPFVMKATALPSTVYTG